MTILINKINSIYICRIFFSCYEAETGHGYLIDPILAIAIWLSETRISPRYNHLLILNRDISI